MTYIIKEILFVYGGLHELLMSREKQKEFQNCPYLLWQSWRAMESHSLLGMQNGTVTLTTAGQFPTKFTHSLIIGSSNHTPRHLPN